MTEMTCETCDGGKLMPDGASCDDCDGWGFYVVEDPHPPTCPCSDCVRFKMNIARAFLSYKRER